MPNLLVVARLDNQSAAPQDRPGKAHGESGVSPFATLLGDKVKQQVNAKESPSPAATTAKPGPAVAQSQAEGQQPMSAPSEADGMSEVALGKPGQEIADGELTAAEVATGVIDLLTQVLAANGAPGAAVALNAVAKTLGHETDTPDDPADRSSGAGLEAVGTDESSSANLITATGILTATDIAAPIAAPQIAATTLPAVPTAETETSRTASTTNFAQPVISTAVLAANSAEGGAAGFQSQPDTPGNGEFAQLLARSHPEGGIGASVSAQVSVQRPDNIVLQQPAGETRWQNELGDKLVWMASAQRQQADLVLNPPQLGRVEVSLTISGDQASAVFSSPNAAVREMLENSLPRLREIMSGAGIDLGEAQINSGSSQQQNGSGEGNRRNEFRPLLADTDTSMPRLADTPRARVLTGRGLVDTFV